MESDQSLAVKEVGGINLDNYFPYQSSFNTVLYVHKRFAKKPRKIVSKVTEKNEKSKIKENEKGKSYTKTSILVNKKEKNKDTVLEQTIKFAKNLVPLVIPPSEDGDTPIYYTLKTCTKCKNTNQADVKCEKLDNVTFEKKRSKKVIETLKKEKKNKRESYSAESSQSNTLDDINMNQSLSCTLSELSDKREKGHKNTVNNKRKKQDSNKIRTSESFDGLATELNDNGETNINIHIMNEKEKHYLIECIRIPIINAVNDRIKGLDNSEIKEDVQSMQRLVTSNSQKLDSILEKLTCIENYLVNSRSSSSSKHKGKRPSRLEQLSEDLIDEKDYTSEEEFHKPVSNKQSDGITVLHSARMEKRAEDLGCGEFLESRPSTSVGVRTDKNKLPARFCWTDAERHK